LQVALDLLTWLGCNGDTLEAEWQETQLSLAPPTA